jgi:hypothetical protein
LRNNSGSLARLAAMRLASSRVSGLVLRALRRARKKRAPNGQGGSWGLASHDSGRPERRDLNRLKTTVR